MTKDGRALIFFGILILFGMPLISFNYTCSFMFDNPETAFKYIPGLCMLLFIFPTVISYVVSVQIVV